MKTAEFVPSVCKGENPSFEGFIKLRLPTFDEKFDYIDKLELKMGDDGTIDLGGPMDRLKYIRKMCAIAKDHYVAVSLKNKTTGEELKSYDDINSEPAVHSVIIEVATKILEGFNLGNG